MTRHYKKLDKIYEKIPSIDCKGLCHTTCGIVPAAKIEIKRARDRMGGKNPFNPIQQLKKASEGGSTSCAALKEGRCSIYTARPGVCRLYGVAEGLDCAYGCKPKHQLSKKEAYDLIREIEAL